MSSWCQGNASIRRNAVENEIATYRTRASRTHRDICRNGCPDASSADRLLRISRAMRLSPTHFHCRRWYHQPYLDSDRTRCEPPSEITAMNALSIARDILRKNLQLGARGDLLTEESALMGALPELNSLTVVSIVASIEELLGVTVVDGEINADVFRTLGSLARFIASKLE